MRQSLRPWIWAIITFAFCLVGFAQPPAAHPHPSLTLDGYLRGQQVLRQTALREISVIANIYRNTDPISLPGIHRLGVQLQGLKLQVDSKFDLDQNVRSNAVFWRAAGEMSPLDDSFPLLYGTLAIVAGDLVLADRVLSLAQAVLPMSDPMRREYLRVVRPLRGVLNYPTRGLTTPASLKTREECDLRYQEIVRRLELWPRAALLYSHKFETQLRRLKIEHPSAAPAEITEKWNRMLIAWEPEIQVLDQIDPLVAAPYTTDEAASKTASAFRRRWGEVAARHAPVDLAFLQHLLDLTERRREWEFSWLIVRFFQVHRSLQLPVDRAKLQKFVQAALPAEAARSVIEEMELPTAGQARLLLPFAPQSIVWSGDPNLHPWVAQSLERELAKLDFDLRLVRDPAREGGLRCQRAMCLLNAGLFDAALAESERAATLLPNDPQVLLAKALALASQRRDREAEEIFKTINAEGPMAGHVARSYGNYLFSLGRFADARSHFASAAELNPHHPYGAIMADLAARRLGEREQKLLEETLALGHGPSWQFTCLQFLAGRIDREEFRSRAVQGSDYEIHQQQCEAAFIQAQIALAEGDVEKGIYLLRECVGTGLSTFVEYWMAARELDRLVPDEPKNPEQQRRPAPASEPYQMPV